MAKLYCEIELKDKTAASKADAIAYALTHEEIWKVKDSKAEQREKMMSHTDLSNKCGSCIHYVPTIKKDGTSSYGNCNLGHAYAPRSKRACKSYERKKGK